MKKQVVPSRLLLFLFLFFIQIGFAQPPICGPNPVMGTTCQNACVICDINGFSGNNPGNTGGSPPPGYCTFAVHAVEWIGFIAGTTDLTLEFAVSNCTVGGGNGLEAGIYEGIDCQNFMLVSNCETAIFNNTSVFISNTVPLTVGQYYWLVVDSNGGNSCDYDITVTAGSTVVPPLTNSGPISGDLFTCPGASIDYSTIPVFGATDYNWTLDGVPSGMGENVNINFPTPGVYNLCVQAANACSTAPPSCVLVNVTPIPPTDHFEMICLGDCVTIGNMVFCAPGIFPITFSSYQGCDSLVNVNIEAIPAIITIQDEEICDGDVVIVGNEEFDETGVYNIEMTGYEGCDSTVVLNLDVHQNPETYLTEEMCDGESFEVGNESFFSTGNYQVYFTSAENCDSIVNLDLTVLDIQESFLTEEICDGDTYEIGNESFSSTGAYQVVFTDVNDCDSLVNLDLTVLIMPESFLDEKICEGGIFEVGNEVFDETGDYQVVLTDQNGCDSLVNLDLTVLVPPLTNLNESICEGGIFEVGNEIFDQTGVFEVTLQGSNGCDSIVELDLEVMPPLMTNLNEEICQGDNFSVGNETFEITGIYEITLSSSTGCDSIVELNLDVLDALETDLNEQICQGDNFELGGESFDSTGIYEVTFSANSGCDSIVKLDLEVLQFLETDLTENICSGESFELGGESFDSSGNYEVTFTAASGCDSIVKLDLTVLSLPETNFPTTICEGDSVLVGNQFFSLEGDFDIVLTAASGCDSTVHLSLTITETLETFLTEEICENDSYSVGNEVFNNEGIYEIPLSSMTGCDSLVHLDLKVNSNVETTLNESICEGDNFMVGGEIFDLPGLHSVTLINSKGCDSLVNLNLEVIDFFEIELTQSVCQGESVSVGNETFDQTGNYEVTLTTSFGCDSLVKLDLTVFDLPETFLTEAICEGESFQIGSEIFDQNGDFQVVLLNQNNCDSTVFLNLTIIEPKQTILPVSLCEGENIQIGTEIFDQTGQFNVLLTAASGCDSLVNLDLTITPPETELLNEQICEGDTYVVGNESFTQSGEYDVILSAASGCDSLVTLNLTVLDFLETNLDEAICEGEIFEIGGEIFDSEGMFSVTLTANSGCDSIVNLDLKINSEPEIFLEEIICEGESVQIGNEIFDQTGEYQVPLFTTEGCDSLVNLDLEIIPNEQTFLNESICENDSYIVGNEAFTQTGQFEVLLSTFDGCDSLVELDLEVIPFEYTDLEETICEGETIQIGNEIFDQTGEYEVVLSAVSGCDSIVSLDLTVIECMITGAAIDYTLLCAGDSDGVLMFWVFGGSPPYNYVWQNSAGTLSGSGTINEPDGDADIDNLPAGIYQITITDESDLEVVIYGEIHQPDHLGIILEISDYGGFNVSCHGGNDGNVDATAHGGIFPYELEWSLGAEIPGQIGAGIYEVTLTDSNGCTFTEDFTLTEPNPVTFEFELQNPDCEPENSGGILIQNPTGGIPDYVFGLVGIDFGTEPEFQNLLPGDYEISVQDANGCEANEFVNLPQPPDYQIDLGEDLTIDLGDSIQLNPIFSVPTDIFNWEIMLGLSCYDCPNPFAKPTENTTYFLTSINEDGCEGSDEITVFVNKNRNVYVPNSFSPNNDGVNDVFLIYGGGELSRVVSLRIFSRWGEPVFQYFDFPPNDSDFGWDGTHRGEDLQPAVFVWFAEVEFLDGEREVLKGDVLLVK